MKPRPLTPAERERLDGIIESAAEPVAIDGFMDDESALSAAATVQSMPFWKPTYRSFICEPPENPTGNDDIGVVSEEEWLREPRVKRQGANEIAVEIPRLFTEPVEGFSSGNRSMLKKIFIFSVMSPALQQWLGKIADPSVASGMNIDFARYRPGDWAGAHNDLDVNRSAVCLWYLDPEYDKSCGGRLCYRNQDGSVYGFEPRFNRLVVMPIAKGSVHWVEPWEGSGTGRHTIGFGIDAKR